MLEEIFAFQAASGDEGDTWIRWSQVRREGDDLLLDLHGRDTSGEQPPAAWLVRVQGLVDMRLTSAGDEGISLSTEHPLLLPHRDPEWEVTVVNAPLDRARLLGRLWEAHDSVLGTWLPPEDFLNLGYLHQDALVAGGMGLLAKGPRTLLEAYAEAAQCEGMEPTSRETLAFRRQGHCEGTDALPPLRVLRLGKSWWIARTFQCRVLPEPPAAPKDSDA